MVDAAAYPRDGNGLGQLQRLDGLGGECRARAEQRHAGCRDAERQVQAITAGSWRRVHGCKTGYMTKPITAAITTTTRSRYMYPTSATGPAKPMVPSFRKYPVSCASE